MIHELAYPNGIKGLVEEIRKISQVLTAYEIKKSDIKNKDYLIAIIELNLITYQKMLKSQKS